MGVNPKIVVENPPKMDGENYGTPYFLIDDFGGYPYFWKHPYGVELIPTFTTHPICDASCSSCLSQDLLQRFGKAPKFCFVVVGSLVHSVLLSVKDFVKSIVGSCFLCSVNIGGVSIFATSTFHKGLPGTQH